MSRRNKVLLVVLVGILTAGIAFGSLNVVNASNSNNRTGVAAGTGTAYGQGRMTRMSQNEQGFHGDGVAMHEEMDKLAAFLGIDEDALTSERQSGKSLAEIAEEYGKSEDELKAFFTEEFTSRIGALLKDGTITQSQYDTMKSNFEGRIDEMINRTATGMPQWAGKGNHAGRKEMTDGTGTGSRGYRNGDCSGANTP